MSKHALAFLFLSFCAVCVSQTTTSADTANATPDLGTHEDATIKKLRVLRTEMLESIKPDPEFDRNATDELKLKKTFQMFRVAEYVQIFDVLEETRMLQQQLRKTDVDSDRDNITLRLQTLSKQRKLIWERIKRLNLDQNTGAGLQLHLDERKQQLDVLEKKKWTLPIYKRRDALHA